MWASSSELSSAWLEQHCGLKCDKCLVTDLSNKTAPRSCFLLSFSGGAQDEKRLVLKQLPSSEDGEPLPARLTLSRDLGLAREALFYKHLAPLLGDLVPSVSYSEGDMQTGEKKTIMEDLSDSVDSGALFGAGNPNNWLRNLPEISGKAGNPEVELVASITFKSYAKLHAKFWREKKLLSHSWLRCADWVRGEGEKKWESSQNYAKNQWEAGKKKLGEKNLVSKFDSLIFAAIEKAVNGISWKKQLERLNENNSNWTLVHGDCWPGNVMWRKNNSVKLVDWEMVGIGSGAQDLGQYVISNMDRKKRAECERKLIEEYFAEILKCGVTNYTFEECWREYTIGGTERWLWFLCYFAGADNADDYTLFFHDQILAFMTDHKISVDQITQIRP